MLTPGGKVIWLPQTALLQKPQNPRKRPRLGKNYFYFPKLRLGRNNVSNAPQRLHGSILPWYTCNQPALEGKYFKELTKSQKIGENSGSQETRFSSLPLAHPTFSEATIQQLPEDESVACRTWPQSPALKSSDTSGEERAPLPPLTRQSRGPPAFWWIWNRTPEHHREKISGSPALFLLLKVNMKKIELLQSVKVLALSIQRHLKLRGGKLKEKENKNKQNKTEPGLLPSHCGPVPSSHQEYPCNLSHTPRLPGPLSESQFLLLKFKTLTPAPAVLLLQLCLPDLSQSNTQNWLHL